MNSPRQGTATPPAPRRTRSTAPDAAARQTTTNGNRATLGRDGTRSISDIWGADFDNLTPSMTLKGPGQTQVPPDGDRTPRNAALPDVALDGYELLRVLGEGGVGVVYQAIQKSIDRTIAVKMIKPDIGPSDHERAKFLTEAMVTGKLDHPNIVPIHDLGTTADGQPFYTMKMVRGTPWNETIRQLPLAENLRILIAVGDAVSFAHARGVIHRDLKPENVMLGEFGEIQVMDWGLGALLSSDGCVADISKTQAAGGTPAYMAPEMVTGDDGPIGIHSDVYLLGAILYEIVTGKPPHGGQRVLDCLQNALFNVIEPTDRQDVLVDIALRAMQTVPADRYPTVAAFNEALRDYQTHAESINLAEQSRGYLNQAIAGRDYDLFAQALFGFRAALTRWAENAEAQAGLLQTQLEYARCAFEKHDLDLAGTMLDPDWPAHQELAADIRRAIQRRDHARRRLRVFRTTAIALTAAVIIILTVASIWIAAAKRQAVRAKEAAVEAQLAEAEQRRLADLERTRAQEEEARAVQALADLEKAVQAMIAAQTQEERAVARAQAADLVAVQTRDELARSGMLLDNSWWAFDEAEAQRRQTEAADALALPTQITVMLAGTTPLDLVLIPPGDFVMGSPPKEERRSADEHLHRVQHSAAFYVARCELTLAQWQALGGTATTGPNNADLPATGLTYEEIMTQLLPALQAYAPAGYEFRLPTEAQWEYACRAGTTTAYYVGDEPETLATAGWYLANSGRQVQPVGVQAPNAFGLYDMHGNASELCADPYDANFYLVSPIDDPTGPDPAEFAVVRGGSVLNTAEQCRSAFRSYMYEKNRYEFVGVRLALVPRCGD